MYWGAKMRINAIVLFVGLMLGITAGASDLKNVNTFFGSNGLKPENKVLKCIVDTGVLATFGQDRTILAYSHGEPVGDNDAPAKVAIIFITTDQFDNREILKVILESTDSEKHWQYVRGATGEVYLFSTTVSSKAVLTKKDGVTEIVKFDILNCQ